MPANSSEMSPNSPQWSFEYAIIRVMPRVERGEFCNVGALLLCVGKNFLEARVEVNETRLKALFPDADFELINAHLQSFARICAGGKNGGTIGQLSQRERFRWLASTRSTMVQTSPIHCGMCDEPDAMLEQILDAIVR